MRRKISIAHKHLLNLKQIFNWYIIMSRWRKRAVKLDKIFNMVSLTTMFYLRKDQFNNMLKRQVFGYVGLQRGLWPKVCYWVVSASASVKTTFSVIFYQDFEHRSRSTIKLKDLAIKKIILQKLFLSARPLGNLKLTGN